MYARVIANGTDMGVYEGDDEDAVLDAYARDAGYADYADLLDSVPDASPEDVELEAVGIARLFGGDAARQRADTYADEHGGTVAALDVLPRSMLQEAGLSPHYRDSDGTQYAYAVLQEE
jgi:hypothetical protein